MATNLAIDPDLLERAVEVSGERTKKAVVTKALQEFIARDPGFLKYSTTDGKARFGYMMANVPLLLKGLSRMTQDGTYLNAYPCDVDFALWRGLKQWFQNFVIAATPGNGNEVWHTAVCR